MSAKSFYCLFIFLLFPFFCKSQSSWNWRTVQSTSTSEESSYSVAVDSSNKFIYTCGYITHASAFSNLSTSVMNAGNGNGSKDAFLAKHDYAGNLIWCVTMGSVNNDEAYSINFAADGNIYVTGYCEGNCIFNSVNGSSTVSNSLNTGKDIFLASYTSNGKVRWVKRGGGVFDDAGQSICSSKNAVYVMGIYQNAAAFGPYSTDPLFNNKTHYFIAAYSFSGVEQWLTEAKSNDNDGIGDPFEFSHPEIICSNDTLFLIGEAAGNNMTFIHANGSAFSTILGNSTGNESVFYSALTTNGTWLWSQQIKTGASPQLGFGITADCGGVYISGLIHPSAIFPSSYALESSDHNVPFAARCSRSTGIDAWVKTWPSSTIHNDIATHIKADGRGYLYIAGNFQSINFFSPDASFGLTSGEEMFIAKYKTNGGFVWAQPIKGSGDNFVNDISIEGNKIVLCGSYENDLQFPGLPTVTGASNKNIFLAQGETTYDPLIYSCCNSSPQQAIAANDVTLCSSSTTLSANSPVNGFSQWYVVEGVNSTGAGVITNPLSSNTAVNGLTPGDNLFTWHISTPYCNSSVDTLTISHDAPPSTAIAGNNQTLCATSSSLVLNGNTPSVGTGLWSSTGSSAIIQNPSTATTTVNSIPVGVNTFIWTISNGSCPPSVSTLTVQVDNAPDIALAGNNQTLCANNPSLILNATAPVIGNGMWSIISGTCSITSPTSENTSVNSLSTGTNILQWTISNGVCPSSSSTLSIQIDQLPTPALAGSNQTLCANNPSVILNANLPSIGSGIWSVISGTANISLPASESSPATSLATGTNIFQWITYNGVCPSSSSTVAIQVDQMPTAALAGNNQTICANNPSLTLNASTPVIGNGLWSVIGGTSSIASPASENTNVTSLSTGTNILQWTISNGICPSSSSTVLIQVDQLPTTALAGNNQTICANVPSLTLNATTPVIGNGLWSVISGTCNVASPASENTNVTSLSTGTNILQWTISNGVCPPSSSTLSIQVDQLPSTALAGNNQTLCANNPSLILNATAPVIGNGMWSIISGTCSIASPTSENTSVNSLSTGTNILQWTISNGVCPSSSSTLSIQIDQLPTPALAGSNQTLCANVYTLNANTPVIGNGKWNVITGSSAVTNILSPVSHVTNLDYGLNSLEWKISNGVCPSSKDTVFLSVSSYPDQAVTIPDYSICETDSLILQANNVTTGTGSWSIIQSAGNINNPLLSTTHVKNFSFGENIFRWTIINAPCPSTSKDLKVNVYQLPSQAVAGNDQIAYSDNALLTASSLSVGTGNWSSFNSSYIEDPSNVQSQVSSLLHGENIFIWKVTNGVCPFNSDTVKIIREDITVPNAFSPNADNLNDEFIITGIESFGTTHLVIYNRWGSIVFESNNYQNNWTGKGFDGNDVSEDTYYYIIKTEKGTEIKGFVLLKRQ